MSKKRHPLLVVVSVCRKGSFGRIYVRRTRSVSSDVSLTFMDVGRSAKRPTTDAAPRRTQTAKKHTPPRTIQRTGTRRLPLLASLFLSSLFIFLFYFIDTLYYTMTDDSAVARTVLKSEDYIRTASGNFVARGAILQGAQQVELKGRTWVEAGVTLRGDLAPIRVGRYNSIRSGTTIAPPVLNMPSGGGGGNQQQHAPVSIGAHTTIGTDCDIQAAAIGSYNVIGDRVILGPRVILKDAVVVTAGTHVPADTVIPPFTRVSSSSSSSPKQQRQLAWIALSPATIPILQESALDAYHERVRLVTGTSA